MCRWTFTLVCVALCRWRSYDEMITCPRSPTDCPRLRNWSETGSFMDAPCSSGSQKGNKKIKEFANIFNHTIQVKICFKRFSIFLCNCYPLPLRFVPWSSTWGNDSKSSVRKNVINLEIRKLIVKIFDRPQWIRTGFEMATSTITSVYCSTEVQYKTSII
jgi:hypothetical protein